MKRLALTKTDTYGLEIEFATSKDKKLKQALEELISKDNIHSDWKLKEEITCKTESQKGLEINSPIMNQKKIFLLDLKRILKLLEQDTTITNCCGLHIHVGAQAFEDNVSYLQNFILLFCYYEDILLRYGTGEYQEIRRSLQAHAKPIRVSLSEEQIALLMREDISLLEFLRAFLRDFGKIYTVNLHPYLSALTSPKRNLTREKRTVEFRFFAATYDYEIILSFIDTIFQMISYAKKMMPDEKLFYYESLQNRVEYINPNSFGTNRTILKRGFQIDIEKAKEFSGKIYHDERKQKQFMKIYQVKTKSYQ